MKKKYLGLFLVFVVVIVASICLFACSKDPDSGNQLADFESVSMSSESFAYDGMTHMLAVDGAPSDATIDYSQEPTSKPGSYNVTATVSKPGYKTLTLKNTLTIDLPTGEQLEDAREKANKDEVVGYNFELNFAGSVNLGFYAGTANANYKAKYRYNKTTSSMQFYRETSGLLLYDSKEYISNSGDNKMKIKLNADTNQLTSVSVVPTSDVELDLINIPFEKIVDSLSAKEYKNISLNTDVNKDDFMFKSNINFTSENSVMDLVLRYIGNQDTSVKIGNVEFTNPVSGLVIYFNLDKNMKLLDFSLSMELNFPIKNVPVSMALNYSQVADNSSIAIPSTSEFKTSASDIDSTISKINSALLDIKDDAAYSLDVTAKNEFDPGWKVSATKDSYLARMYKNTYKIDTEDFVAFNHSYKYKTHHEEDGKETYNFNYGNLEGDSTYSRGDVYLISRKGSNTYEAAPEVTLDTQFNYLTAPFVINSEDVDCIKIVSKGTTITYELNMKTQATMNVQNKILEMINSNPAEGIIKVDNYMPEKVSVKDSILTVVITDGKLTSLNTETKLKYFPTAGDYVDSRITLSNELSLSVNEKLSTALKYSAPKKADGTIVGFCASKYFIL